MYSILWYIKYDFSLMVLPHSRWLYRLRTAIERISTNNIIFLQTISLNTFLLVNINTFHSYHNIHIISYLKYLGNYVYIFYFNFKISKMLSDCVSLVIVDI